LFAVCSPKLLLGRRKLGKPADILKFPLIHLDSRADWTKWLRTVGVNDAEVTHGPVLNRASMVIDAAIDGQGIALARTTLAAWDIINGRLVRPFAEALRRSRGAGGLTTSSCKISCTFDNRSCRSGRRSSSRTPFAGRRTPCSLIGPAPHQTSRMLR